MKSQDRALIQLEEVTPGRVHREEARKGQEKASICRPWKEASGGTNWCLNLGLGSLQRCRKYISAVGAVQSVIFCYGSPRRLTQRHTHTTEGNRLYLKPANGRH